MVDKGPVSLLIMKGELQVKMSLASTERRSRSKVRVRIVGLWSICWVQVLKDCGASIEAVVEDIPAQFKDIRHLITSTPTITVVKALGLEPWGPWDGCLFAHVRTAQDSILVISLFKRW